MTLTMQEIASRLDCSPADVLSATISADCGPWTYEGETFIDPAYLRTRIAMEVYDVTMLVGLYVELDAEKLSRLAEALDVDPNEIVPPKAVGRFAA